MDFRIRDLANMRSFPSAQEGLRAIARKAPEAEALASSWVEASRPMWTRMYTLRRKFATVVVVVLAGLLLVHVLLGANGMMIYKQKRAEYESLQRRIALEEKENDLYRQQIQGLKTDEKAIEKEAREQLRYARPGEYVYVQASPSSPPPANHSARK